MSSTQTEERAMVAKSTSLKWWPGRSQSPRTIGVTEGVSVQIASALNR
jgi:hypothetical protein